MGRTIEGLAMHIRRTAGFGDEHIVRVGDVVRHWLGRGVDTVPAGRLALGSLERVEGAWRILVSEAALDPRFAAAHELGHWAFREVARVTFASEAEEERAANIFAATLLAPAPLVRRAYDIFGERVARIAGGLRISQTSAVLRLAEVRRDERAVVTPGGRALVRGATLTQERALAAARGKVPGLARTRLRGGLDEGRVALRVVGDGT